MLRAKKGFTIVELLIVVVVIAILAAITIVAYNGIQNRARAASVQADLSSAFKALESEKIKSGSETYPSTLTSTTIPTANTAYFYSSADNSYCMTKSNGTTVYHISSSIGSPSVGNCGEDSLLASWQLDGDANDSVGAYNSTSILNVTTVAGQDGTSPGGYQFNGSNSEINFPLPTNAISNVAVSAWIYMQSTTKGAVFHVGNNSGGYSLGLGDGYNTVNRKLVGLFPSKRWVTTTSYISDGWHHIAMSLASDSTPTIYLDGDIATGGPFPGVAPIIPANAFVMGRNTGDDGGSASERVFNGRIDDVRFFKRSITAADAKGMFTAGAR